MHARAIRSWLLATCALLGACTITADLPPEFLRLDGGWRELKAMTPDDARIWIREFDDPEDGNLEFWSAALRNDLVDRRGYVPLDEPSAILDAHGTPGSVQQFRNTRDGLEYGYLVAVFVESGRIVTAEFTAPRALYDRHVAGVLAMLPTIQS